MHKSFKINIISEGFDRILSNIYKLKVGFSTHKKLDTQGPVASASNAVPVQHKAPEALKKQSPGKGTIIKWDAMLQNSTSKTSLRLLNYQKWNLKCFNPPAESYVKNILGL